MTDVSPSYPTMDLAVERRKRVSGSEEELSAPKRPRMSFYIRLESESSRASDDDDTESVYSIQDKETDVARDSDSDSEVGSSSELESGAELVTLEYDVASLSSGDDFPDYTSSGTEDMNMQAAAEGALAAVLLDTSLEPWETAGDTSDGSTIFDAFDFVECRRDFWTCLQCNMHNDNPAFRYCDKCFQKCWQCKVKKTFKGFPLCIGCFKVRKTFFPPRPRPTRKRKHHDESSDRQRVKVDTLRTCLRELTDNPSGARELAEGPSSRIPSINFEGIVVPEKHLKRRKSESSDAGTLVASTRTHDVSDSDLFDEDDSEATPRKKRCKIDGDRGGHASKCCSQDSGIGEKTTSSQELTDDSRADSREGQSSSASSSRAQSSSPGRAAAMVLNATNLKRHTDEAHNQHSDSKPESDSGVSSRHTYDDARATIANPVRDDMCMMCTSAPKNGIFLHGSIGHTCCCYKCAMRVWKSSKRCPVCNCKVKNVVKLFMS